jgi:hypothetical protein
MSDQELHLLLMLRADRRYMESREADRWASAGLLRYVTVIALAWDIAATGIYLCICG